MADPLNTWSPAMFFYWLLSHSMHCIGSNHRQQQLFNIFLMEKGKHNSTVTWTSKNYPGPWWEFETWTSVLEMWRTLGLNEYTVGKVSFPGMICLNCELGQMGTRKWSKASFSLFSTHACMHASIHPSTYSPTHPPTQKSWLSLGIPVCYGQFNFLGWAVTLQIMFWHSVIADCSTETGKPFIFPEVCNCAKSRQNIQWQRKDSSIV